MIVGGRECERMRETHTPRPDPPRFVKGVTHIPHVQGEGERYTCGKKSTHLVEQEEGVAGARDAEAVLGACGLFCLGVFVVVVCV